MNHGIKRILNLSCLDHPDRWLLSLLSDYGLANMDCFHATHSSSEPGAILRNRYLTENNGVCNVRILRTKSPYLQRVSVLHHLLFTALVKLYERIGANKLKKTFFKHQNHSYFSCLYKNTMIQQRLLKHIFSARLPGLPQNGREFELNDAEGGGE